MSNFSALKTAIQNAIKQNGNEEITGNLLQGILLSIVETLGDSAINTLETGLSNEATTRGDVDTQLNNLITGVKTNVDNGYVYAGIATPSTTPVSGKVFYIALQAGTYTNLGGMTVTEGITILKYNGTSWVKEQVLFTDGGVFDISAYHATGGTLAKYADLTAALGTSGANIPQSIRKGGMSVKFVQSSDNKYVQYRLMSDIFNTTVANWQGVDDEPTAGSDNLVKSSGIKTYVDNHVSVSQNTLTIGGVDKGELAGQLIENPEWVQVVTDSEDKILYGVKTDGKFYFGDGCPPQVQEYVTEHLAEIIAALNNKVEKVTGKSLIDAGVASSVEYIENPEWVEVVIDASGKTLWGITKEGIRYEMLPLIVKGVNVVEELHDLDVRVDTLEEEIGTTSIIAHYPENALLPKLQNLILPHFLVGHINESRKNLCLLHFSDIHNYSPNMLQLKAFINKYGEFIDDVIHTGDLLKLQVTNSISEEWDESWLNIAGNHDSTIIENSDHILVPAIDTYNKILAPYIDGWNVVQPQGASVNGYCYYYKDYPNEKVRLIALDPLVVGDSVNNRWTIEQKSWLENTLNDTLDENNSAYGYHILIATHYPPFVIEPDADNMFQGLNRTITSAQTYLPDIPIAINSFINNGGKFICYLCGHTHYDFVGKNNNYPGQLVITIAGALDPTDASKRDNSARVEGTRTQYCFNVFDVDTHACTIKVLRLGSDIDMDYRRKESFSYNYDTQSYIKFN